MSTHLFDYWHDPAGNVTVVGFKCPGCGYYHAFRTTHNTCDGPKWQYNGPADSPTMTGEPSSSMRVQWTTYDLDVDGKPIKDAAGHIRNVVDHTCHFFLTDGLVDFCADCTHEAAGRKLPPVPIED